MIKRQQIDQLYVVRALAILGVIIVHSTSFIVSQLDQSSSFWPSYNFLNSFFKIGTTTFIFLSAFVLFYNYYHRPLTKALVKNFYKRRLLYILIPYFIFSTVYYTMVAFANNYDYSLSYMVTELIKQILTGKAYTHLYFVFISVQFFLMFPLFLWAFKKWPLIAKNLFWIGIVIQWGFIFYNKYYWQNTSPGNLSIWYASYYFLGAYLGIYYDHFIDFFRVKKENLLTKKAFFWFPLWTFWLIASSGYVYIWYLTRAENAFIDSRIYNLFWNAHTLITALVLLQLSYWIYDKWPKPVVNAMIHLGVVSFGVYITHPIVLFFYRYTTASGNSILYHIWVVGGFLAALLIPWAIVGFSMKYFKGSWIFFGAAPKIIPYKKSRKELNKKKNAG